MSVTSDVSRHDRRPGTMWSRGEYASVAELFAELSEILVERTLVLPGMEVLDVGTGNGNAAIEAAFAGGRVTGLDLTPELLTAAQARAERAGVDITWVEGDAEAIPFADACFDRVLSTLAAPFVPRQDVLARELVRVCKPGGVVGLANWTPQSFMGRFLRTIAAALEGRSTLAATSLWGGGDHVRTIFAGTELVLTHERGTVRFEHYSPTSFVYFLSTHYGPLVSARETLLPTGRWDDLRRDLVALCEAADAGVEGRFSVPSEYLIVVGRRDTVA